MRLTFVLGMHRSGTSAVAGLLARLGADLGEDDRLLQADTDNPKGFFENLDVKAVDDAVLAKLGGTWDRLPTFPPGWQHDPGLDPQRQRGAVALDDLRGRGSAHVVVKDPRLSLTLPWWRTLAQVDDVLLCVRDPAAVTASLQRRNGITRERAEELWTAYTLHALAAAPDAIVVPFARVTSEPGDVARELAEQLGLEATDEAAAFIDADLDHGTDLDDASPTARWLHDFVVTSTPTDRRAFAGLVAPLLHGHADARGLVEDLRRRHDELAEGVRRRDESMKALRDARERDAVSAEFLHARIRRREHDLGAARSEVKQHLRELDALRASTDRLRVELSRQVEGLEQQVSLQGEQLEQSRSRQASAQQRVNELEQDLVDMRRARDAVRDERKQVAKDLRKARRDFDRLRNRRSVRLTLGIASAARPLFRAVRAVRSPQPELATPDETPRDDEHATDDRAADVADDARIASPTPLVLDVGDTTMTSPLAVVIPVHDAPEDVRRCLEAVIANTTTPADVIVIDDASQLDETRAVLDELGAHPGVRVLRNEENLGYTRTVNRGIAESVGDVVLLNSDTIVPPRWTEQLRLALASDPTIGTVTAMSDNAGAFAAPVIGAANDGPAGLDLAATARIVAQESPWTLPSVVTCNGFCVLLRREMLDDVGVFDAEAFPRGYGEENDLSLRAAHRGWKHVAHDALYVHHAKGRSFGDARDALIAQGREVVDERYPEYTQAIRDTFRGPAMDAVRDRIAERFAEADGDSGRPRVLAVLHEGRGGTPNTTIDLATTLSDRWDTWMLTCDTRTFRLSTITADGPVLVETWTLDEPIRFGELNRADVRRILVDILVRHAFEVVHVRHVVKNTFDVLDVAHDLAIPTVVSFHDFYLSCPTVHLLDDQQRFCGGTCTPGQGSCTIPMGWIAEDAPHLKHGWVHEWRREIAPRLERASALVTTSETARDVYRRSYPDAALPPFEVIEHGRDLDPTPVPWSPPQPGGVVRLLVPGNLDAHKGAAFLRRMVEADTLGRLELHFLGASDTEADDLGTMHGTYERDDFARRVAEIDPHFIGLFSIWAETYCHTLSEAWMTGIPVVVTDIGALGERVRAHDGGLAVPVDDPAEALRMILTLADDPVEATRLSGVHPERLVGLGRMADAYGRLYRRGLAERTLAGSTPVDLGLVAIGDRTAAPGSVNVRSLRPLTHPRWAGSLTVRVLTSHDVVDARLPADHVHVQRTAVAPDDAAAFVAACEARGLAYSFDVDDLLFDPEAAAMAGEDYASHVDALQHLMRHAALVTTSTTVIADAAERLGFDSRLVPNQIDERLWFTRLPGTAQPQTPRGPGSTARLLYVGSPTHDADLATLQPVMEGLRDRGVDAELTVIGVTRSDDDWYRRLPVPPRTAHYPAFVAWLRRVAVDFDLTLAPLVDSPFNRAKSDLKFLEYAALGLPSVYADVRPYRDSVEDGVTGRLARDVDGWVDAVAWIAAHPDEATAMADRARDHVRTSRTLATAPADQSLARLIAELRRSRP